MTTRMEVLDCKETRLAREQIKWANEKLELAKCGVRFDKAPVGHDRFMENLVKLIEHNEDILLRNTCLRVIA